MLVSELDWPAFYTSLRKGLNLRLGAFVFKLGTNSTSIARYIHSHYRRHEIAESQFVDHRVFAKNVWGAKRLFNPSTVICYDGLPGEAVPRKQSIAVFEWIINRCFYTQEHSHLLIHSGSVEKNDRGLILVGDSGAGKSTLTAALQLSGWRILSDEFAIVDFENQRMSGIGRPIILKNNAKSVLEAEFGKIEVGPSSPGTIKGTVYHLPPKPDDVCRATEQVGINNVIFVKYQAGRKLSLAQLHKAEAFGYLARTSFNYGLHGERGFHCLTDIIQSARVYSLNYSSLSEAIKAIDELS